MDNRAFQRALLSLSHPATMGAILVLLLNDHLFRRVSPSWLTGKIGDFTWLVFAPFLLTTILAWLIPSRVARREARIGQLSIAITGMVFALAKTVPAFHALTIRVLESLTGWPNVLRLDPTDVIALPALWIAWRVWTQSETQPARLPSRGWVLLPLAALATISDSPAPNYGITRLELRGSLITTRYFNSEDGGLTWQSSGVDSGSLLSAGYTDRRSAWVLSDPNNERFRYRFTPGVSIERSDDGGQTWKMDFSLAGDEARAAYLSVAGRGFYATPLGPLDAVIHRPTGNIVAAMGHEGVLVRTPDGVWRWVTVGDYAAPDLRRPDHVISLLSGEMWLALALAVLTISTVPLRWGRSGLVTGWLSRIVLALTWAGWLAALVLFAPAMSTGYLQSIGAMGAGLAIVLAAPAAISRAGKVYRLQARAGFRLVAIGAIGGIVFLLPFVVWSQGGIPHYGTATIYALVLGLATLVAGHQYLWRAFPAETPTSPSIAS